VTFSTRIGGAIVGAPQLLTISLSQGPAAELTVSASVPGGQPSRASIKSGQGPIVLVLPRFVCYLPPQPTFCPPAQTVVGPHHYVLTFRVTPYTPPVGLSATVDAG
jgi:hypothetical protein